MNNLIEQIEYCLKQNMCPVFSDIKMLVGRYKALDAREKRRMELMEKQEAWVEPYGSHWRCCRRGNGENIFLDGDKWRYGIGHRFPTPAEAESALIEALESLEKEEGKA